MQEQAYAESIERWREKRLAHLMAEDGELTWAGLFWLHEGVNTIGADPTSDVVLPVGSAPAQVGHIEFHAGQAVLHVATDTPVLVDGQAVRTVALQHDMSGKATFVRLNHLTLFVIKRGERFGIRLRDTQSDARRNFKGLRWYPSQAQYCVTAQFVPHAQPTTISIINMLGDTSDSPSPGYVVFTLQGQEVKLIAEGRANALFFNFKDATSGQTTYPPGRFLYTELPQDGQVVIDFNQAYNPPCAFTAFATCPLPPRQNYLNVKIEAGEQYTQDSHG